MNDYFVIVNAHSNEPNDSFEDVRTCCMQVTCATPERAMEIAQEMLETDTDEDYYLVVPQYVFGVAPIL